MTESGGDWSFPHADAAWIEPHTLSSPAPWAGHIPFAAWLAASMRPRTLVELGVYSGISYLAFCQAAVEHGVALRAWGVDTWEGDVHAGQYDQRVLEQLRLQHDDRYGQFSTLLQMRFDDALPLIADGSVDLLHIDGLHTYEAVRHDFEAWRPKLSERGVVLFHDTEVRRDDFGVWRFWAEVTQRFPWLSFDHSNGLGVLLVGAQAPRGLLELSRDGGRWAQARRYFRVLGERFQLRAQAIHADTVTSDLQGKAQAQHDWIRQQDARLLEAEQILRVNQDSIRNLQAVLSNRDQEISQLQQEMGKVTRQARRTAQELQAVLASRSWRVTSGLRKLGRTARELKASPQGTAAATALRHARKAVNYAATGNWRALMQRVRHVKQQAANEGRLNQFEGNPLRCGILATPHTLYVAHAIQAAVRRAALEIEIVQESSDGYPLQLYFVVCPQMFKHLPPGEKRIAFQMEQTVSSRWFKPDYLGVLENSLAALDYAQTNIANLADYGIVYPHVYLTPIGGIQGYGESLGQTSIEPDETCDVLFYGDANAPRRQHLLDAIAARFRLRIVRNSFGDDMRRALAGAKVVVNLHYYEGALLETTRIYECLSLGKAVVSECAADQSEHQSLESVVRFAPVGDVPALLSALEDALREQSSREGRMAYAERCEAAVRASQQRFEFMLYRMLLARRIISYTRFDELTSTDPPPLPARVALSLPETTARRQAFEAMRPTGVAVFDGLRYSPGWVGCALSYKHLARSALRQQLPRLEIMEDDVEFPPDYTERRARVEAFLARRAGQWDVFVGVMALLHPDTQVLNVERVDGETFVTIDRMISMVSNIYTPEALRLMADWDESNQDAETNTIDRFLQSKGNLRVVVTLPFLVGHREDVDSSLWGISNSRYAQLIEQAQGQLERLVANVPTSDGAVSNR